MRKDAQLKDGWGRGLQNKKSRTSKHNHDRVVDKRRREEGRRIIQQTLCGATLNAEDGQHNT